MKYLPIISVSGGKDSTALYLLAQEYFGNDFLPIFADTGNEHPVTVNYVRNLHVMANGPEVVMVKADFSKQLKKKGIQPTGNPFADMMLWKGRAPSTKAQFCTEHVKLWPILFYLEKNYPRDKYQWKMFTGIRAGESIRRSKMQPFSWNSFFDCPSVLPLLYETEETIFSLLESRTKLYDGVDTMRINMITYEQICARNPQAVMKDLFGNDTIPGITNKGKINPCIAFFGKGPDGAKCKSCRHLYVKEYAGRYFKCGLRRDSGGPATDHRVNWPACGKFKTICDDR